MGILMSYDSLLDSNEDNLNLRHNLIAIRKNRLSGNQKVKTLTAVHTGVLLKWFIIRKGTKK